MEIKNDNVITSEGHKDLKEELRVLIDVERPKVIQEIKEARLLGDLSENAEFNIARNRQGEIEDRIVEIEYILNSSKVVKSNEKPSPKVSVGSTVVLEIDSKSYIYKIVGSLEADPFAGKISVVSPLGKELIGKETGATISYLNQNTKNPKKIIGKISKIQV